MGRLRNFEISVFRRVRRDPPAGKIHRMAFWLFLAYLIFLIGGVLPGGAGTFFGDISDFTLLLLIGFCIPLFWRWLMGRALWKVRNRLVVTYLLMGLAPVVLFVTLALILLYVFSGQFAIFAANSVIDLERAHLALENRSFDLHAAHTLAADPRAKSLTLPEFDENAPNHEHAEIAFSAFANGRAMPLSTPELADKMIQQLPSWMHGSFRGIVIDQGKLFLRAVDTQTVGSATVTTVTNLPLQKQNVDQIANGLGAVTIIPGLAITENEPNGKTQTKYIYRSPEMKKGGVHVQVDDKDFDAVAQEAGNNRVEGGELPPSQHFYDIPVTFVAPLETFDWQTGKSIPTYIQVTSRPSALYQRLFLVSLRSTGGTAAVWRDVFIGIAIFFGVLELFAFFLAMRLNRTITQSIRNLYHATEAIDHGDFSHRIPVTRKDQLAALSRSFNSMTASIARLLGEQREKERLQNELSIAQEVQANLFPQSNISLPMLELHGACYPARTVSGDYYDFLVFGEAGLGIALGDISGKGISAALLMATLHSAVRAYRFAGEETAIAGKAVPVMAGSHSNGHEEESGELFEEPAKILALLNRHLYRSTQPEKYATLFLAHYDGTNRRLVYSTGGQLPPLLLRASGSVSRLDCGGTVVGLIDDVRYEQGVEKLSPGDILIAYSDGVTEPENEFGEFGEDRLLEVVRRHRHLPLEAISEQVMQSLRSWIGGQEQPDDITLVLARQR